MTSPSFIDSFTARQVVVAQQRGDVPDRAPDFIWRVGLSGPICRMTWADGNGGGWYLYPASGRVQRFTADDVLTAQLAD